MHIHSWHTHTHIHIHIYISMHVLAFSFNSACTIGSQMDYFCVCGLVLAFGFVKVALCFFVLISLLKRWVVCWCDDVALCFVEVPFMCGLNGVNL